MKLYADLGGTAESLTFAGDSFQESEASPAFTLPMVVAVIPLPLPAATWSPARVRWIHRATTTRRMSAMPAEARARSPALRALSSASPARLMEVHQDPARAWREDETATVDRLATLEPSRLGLRPSMATEAEGEVSPRG